MYKNVAERGPWGSLFIDAFQAFKPREFSDSALIRYMLLAELGYEMGISNAAFILDRGSPLLIFSSSHSLKSHAYSHAFHTEAPSIGQFHFENYEIIDH